LDRIAPNSRSAQALAWLGIAAFFLRSMSNGTNRAMDLFGFYDSVRRELAMSTASYQAPNFYQASFDNVEQQRLLDEDTSAFTGVSGILLLIVSAGLLLGIASVLIILAGG
jgi:hypothetical protein